LRGVTRSFSDPIDEVRFGSWLCENALKGRLIRRDFSDAAAIGHFAEFGAFSFRKGF
jgi:hypothetical protein